MYLVDRLELEKQARKDFIDYLKNDITTVVYKEKKTTGEKLTLWLSPFTQIPIPTLSEQQTIVKAIEQELHLVNTNKRLIEIFEQKIKTKIGDM